MANRWRYFRLNGPPSFLTDEVFTVKIHHGGRIHSRHGLNRMYIGGEVCYIDNVDPDRLGLTLLNTWAYDLGYENGVVNYWYRCAHVGAEFLPMSTDQEVMDMVSQLDSSRVLDMFIVALGDRREFTEEELDVFIENINHLSFMGHVIADIEDEEVGAGINEVGEDTNEGEPDDVRVVSAHGVGESVDVDDDVDVDYEGDNANGDNVDVPGDKRDKGKKKIGEGCKKLGNKKRLIKPRQRRYNTRGGRKSSEGEPSTAADDVDQLMEEDSVRFVSAHGVGESVDVDDDVDVSGHGVRESVDVVDDVDVDYEGDNANRDDVDVPGDKRDKGKKKVGESSKKNKNKGKKKVGESSKKNRDKGKQKIGEGCKKLGNKKRLIKPRRKRYNTRGGRKRSEGEPSNAAADDDGVAWSTDDSDDPDYAWFQESDYEENSEGDCQQFRNNVDGDEQVPEEMTDQGYEGYISEEDDGSDVLISGSSGESENDERHGTFHVKSRKRRYDLWREFNATFDMKNPTFELGMAFPNRHIFKQAVKKHAVLRKKELIFVKNDKKRVRVVCKSSEGCPFTIYAASHKNEGDTFYVRTLDIEHSCSSVGGKVYHLTAPFIAQEYADTFARDPNWHREGIQAIIDEDLKQAVGLQTCYRAKKLAEKKNRGTCVELKKTNPGTSAFLKTNLEGDKVTFEGIYICFKGLADGWKVGCRPIICLDGCHFKGVHKGILLAAVGIDGNNGMYPVAWAIVTSECKETWKWFMEYLQADLSLDIDHGSVEFMSDKQKGLEQVIKDMFPNSNHRNCVRHLHNNFKHDGHSGLELKQLLWDAARSTTDATFDTYMKLIKVKKPTAFQWLEKRAACHWSRHKFKKETKCDMLLNNQCESFNASILDARKKSILPLLEDIRVSVMVRLANRRNSGERWKCNVGPRIERVLKKSADFANEYQAFESSRMRFEVKRRGPECQSGVISQHAVKLDTHECTCKRWDISGLPCHHAICEIYTKGQTPDDYVHRWFSKTTYMDAYNVTIEPIAGHAEWTPIDRPIEPPKFKKLPGRPKNNDRTKEPGEGEVPPPVDKKKLSRAYYTQVKCSKCKQLGHNKTTCERRQAAARETAEMESDVHEGPNQQSAETINVGVEAPIDPSQGTSQGIGPDECTNEVPSQHPQSSQDFQPPQPSQYSQPSQVFQPYLKYVSPTGRTVKAVAGRKRGLSTGGSSTVNMQNNVKQRAKKPNNKP